MKEGIRLVGVRFPEEILDIVAQIAEEEEHDLSHQVRICVKKYLISEGYLKGINGKKGKIENIEKKEGNENV